jgi:glycosyltransferase involved in cell wall biosynthesis
MRIGIDATPITNLSGTGYYTQKLIEFLGRADSDNRYIIFCPNGYAEHLEYPGMFDFPNFRVIELKIESPAAIALWRQFSLPSHIKKLGIDLFHFPAFIAALGIDIPTVITVHDLCFALFPEAFSALRGRYYRFIIPRSVRRCDAVIADSESTRKDIVEHLPVDSSRVGVIHLGVDPARFYHVGQEEERAQLRRLHDLPEDFILYVGVLEPRKNLPRLLRAFSQGVVSKGLPQNLVIAGRKGWKYGDIFREVGALGLEGKVLFPGYIEPARLATLYSMARALAYPSLYEGFGLPCLEAMSCGTPVVTSDRSSLPELVDDCGLIVDPTSVDSIADALHDICSDDDRVRQLSARGIDRARHFSWLTTARKTVEIYERTMADTS